MKTLCLKIPEALDFRITTLAKRARTTKSNVVRAALDAYLDDEVKTRSFAGVAGDLIGCLDSGIGDLSHNKKHMKDYGR